MQYVSTYVVLLQARPGRRPIIVILLVLFASFVLVFLSAVTVGWRQFVVQLKIAITKSRRAVPRGRPLVALLHPCANVHSNQSCNEHREIDLANYGLNK